MKELIEGFDLLLKGFSMLKKEMPANFRNIIK